MCTHARNIDNRPLQPKGWLKKYAKVCCLLVAALITLTNTTQAQIGITTNTNAQALSQLLAGQGVTISNYTRTCDNNGSGTFTNTGTNLGLTQGVVLATGRVTNVPNAANNFASNQFSNNNDAQLSTLTSGDIYDKCILEFDIIPQGNYLKFDYVFASEEYPEFVCSPYNDVFGFFISGPNPGGGNYTNYNIATIPSTTLPVCINSVNPGTSGTYNGTTWNSNNCVALNQTGFYTNNLTPLNTRIVYDGMTKKLTAIAAVTPCQTYHLKLAIADVGDRIYDSGVFLEAYSFTSAGITVSASGQLDYAGYTSAYEGCVGGTFRVSMPAPQTTDLYVDVVVSGTATNGIDYTNIPATVVIPAGQTYANIDLNPLQDGLSETSESVTVAIVNPCTGLPTSSATLMISDNTPLNATAVDTTLCTGQSTQLNVTGGVSYTWTPTTGLSNPNIANPVATPSATTNYIVAGTWGACVKRDTITVHVSNLNTVLSSSPSDTMCNGSTLLISANTTGGTAPYTYIWSTGSVLNAISVTAGGAYRVTTTDAEGCSVSAVKNVYISNPLASAVATNTTCNGNTGTVALMLSGANLPAAYVWNDGNTQANRTGLAAGIYSVTITDANGCTATASATVGSTTPTISLNLAQTNVLCYNGNTGTITTTVTGGTAPYNYVWGGGITAANRSNLTAGTYTVTVTDANACSTTASTIISQPAAALSVNLATNNVSCYAGNNGTIAATVIGGTSSYTYNWGGGITAANRSNLTAGTYNVTVTDANACSTTASATISQPAAALSVNLATNNVSCYAGNNGTIAATVTGGTSSYTYNWGGGITAANRSNLTAGTYNVTVTDANACSTTASATIAQPAAALSVSLAANNVLCYAGNNGTIAATVTGGTSSYTYNWGGGIAAANRTGLVAGTYTVTVTDANACSTTASATIAQPAAALSVSLAANNVLCYAGNNGTITTNVIGGTTAYTYNWGGGVVTANRTNLTAGTYSLTVTDANACTAAASTIISQPSVALSVSLATNNVSCFAGNNGNITTSVTGGTTTYNYNWGGGVTAANRTGLTAGTYNLTVTDANACSTTASATIAQPAAALAVSLAANNVSCYAGNNGTITTTVTGGISAYTYNWGGGVTAANRTGLTAGTYNVTVTDANACSTTASATIAQPAAALAVSLAANNVSCYAGNNGTITTTVTGGISAYTYNWGGGIATTNRTNLTAGTYNLTVTDANTCSTTASTTITQPTAALSVSLAANNVSCYAGNNGTIATMVTGGTTAYTYNWGGGVVTANRTNLTAGTYTVTVTDANTCSTTASTTIAQPTAALAVSLAANNVLCYAGNNGTITTNVIGGTTAYTYNWGGGVTAANRTGLTAGTYNVTVTDANACSTTASATIAQPAAALSVSLAANNVSCYGGNNGTIATTVTGGISAYTYNWGGGVTTANRTNLVAGTYNVTVTDANACSATASTTVAQPSAALSVNLATNNVSCYAGNNGNITTSVTGGTTTYNYNWGGGITAANRTNLIAGTYTVTVIDANACTATGSTTITQPAAALAISLAANNVSCFGGNNGVITTTVTGGTTAYSYNWGGGVVTANRTNLIAGTYTVTVTDANACSTTASATIAQPAAALAVSLAANNVSCYGGNNGTIATTVTGGTAAYTYNWGGGVTTANRTGLVAGTYTLTVTDANACSATASATISQPAAALSVSLAANNVSCYAGNNGTITTTVTGGISAYTYNWGGSVTAANRTNLTAGTYTVTVTDANACSTTASATIAQPAAALAVSLAANNVSCYAGNNGTIAATVIGGTSSYTYNWGGGVATANRANLAAGTYNLTVTDANACTAAASTIISQPTAALSVNLATNNVSCYNGNNGTIATTVTGGTTAYTYNWGGGVTAANRTGLTAGTYTVTITDANACSATASTIISQPAAALSVSLAANNVSCFGGNNGTITTTVTGGISAYTYNWGGGVVTANRIGLTAGTYNVTVTDANACSTTASTAIAQPAAALSVSLAANNVSCYGGNNGTIATTVAGGTTAYNYNWGGGITAANRTGLSAGTYSVTVTDANACSTTASATISQPAAALSVNLATNNVSCYNGNNGTIATTVTGGTTAYTYNWGGGVTAANRTGLAAGTYTVTITDANACSTTASTVVSQPTAALAVSLTKVDILCNGGNNGSVNALVNGGTQPYNYAWAHNQQLNNNISVSLPAGYYNVSVTDANNCIATTGIEVIQPYALSATVAKSNVSCHAGSDGAMTVYGNGGTVPYTYAWSHSAQLTNNTSTTLPAGYYVASVTDANNCSTVVNANIVQPSAISVLANVQHAKCFGSSDGAVALNVAGGVSPYLYTWGNGQQNSISNSGTLPAGYYTVQVTDANNCTASVSYTINQPAQLNSTVSSLPISCYGGSNGSATVTVSGGSAPYSTRWSNNQSNTNIGQLQAGTYSVTVTDNNQCTTTNSINVMQPPAINIAFSNTNIACNNNAQGAIATSVGGGTYPYTYRWNTGASNANIGSLQTGTYTLTVTDANNCTLSASSSIIPTSSLPVSISPINITCNGYNDGKISTAINGGSAPYTFAWSNGASSANLQALTVGNYTLTVTDHNSCSAIANAQITQPAPININTNTTPALCHSSSNGTITVVVVGGTQPYEYDWQDMPGTNNPPNRNNVPAGLYKLTVGDANHCPANAIAQVTEPGPLNSTVQLDNPNCYGDSTGNIAVFTTGGTAPYNYTWSNNRNGNTITNLTSGSYSVNISDSHNCSVSATVQLQSPSQLLASATHTRPTCYGYANGSIDVDVAGGVTPYTYLWSDMVTTQDRPNIVSSNYVVTVTDNNGCKRSLTVPVAQPDKLDIDADVTNIACYGNGDGSISTTILGGTAPYAFTWSNGQTSNNVGGLDAGAYSISVVDNKGCSFNATYTVTQPAATLFTSIDNIHNTCFGQLGGAITVSATGGSQPYNYHWNTGGTHATLNNLGEGYYEVTITDANGCTIENSAPIIELPQLVLDAAIHNPRCDNGKGSIDVSVLSGAMPVTYLWNNNSTAEDILQARTGNYTLTVTDANGCIYKHQYSIEENTQDPFTVYAGEDTTVKLGETVELTGVPSHDAVSMIWGLPSGLSCTDCATTMAMPVRTTTYTLTATDKDGCVATDEVTINIEAWGTVFTPNAFSPNGDGNNDVWQVYGSKNIWKSIDILIFNRWGEKMFETNDANVGWDGMYKGEEAPMAVYVYVVNITYIDGRREADMKGSLTLVR